MSRSSPLPDGWFGLKEHRPARLRLVPGPQATPCPPAPFPFWLAVVIAAASLGAGALVAHYWLIPVVLVQDDGFKAPTLQVDAADLLEEPHAPGSRVARIESVQPPPSAPSFGRPAAMPAMQAETLVRGEWERAPEEPYDPSELLEEAHLPFPVAKETAKEETPPRKNSPKASRPAPTDSKPRETAREAPQGVSSPARVLRRRDPVYPKSARRDGVEGRVVLSVQVRSDGRVGSVRVATSSGSAILDSAAVSAVKSWSFAPEMKNGARIGATVKVPFLFALK